MNGRIYDPVLGRFLSADPFIDGADDSQGFNRYSYVHNNPLNHTDPTGFLSLGDVVKIVAVVVVGILTAGAAIYGYGVMMGGSFAGGFLGALGSVGLAGGWGVGWAVATGAGFGFGSSFAASLLNGGSIGDAFKAGVVGGIVGGISAGVASAIGSFAEGHAWFRGLRGQDWAHGLSQGLLTEGTGGEFRHGFYAGLASSALGPAVQSRAPGGLAGQTAAAAVVGGTASAIGGGKFANGAISGAFTYLFNQASHAGARWTKETRTVERRTAEIRATWLDAPLNPEMPIEQEGIILVDYTVTTSVYRDRAGRAVLLDTEVRIDSVRLDPESWITGDHWMERGAVSVLGFKGVSVGVEGYSKHQLIYSIESAYSSFQDALGRPVRVNSVEMKYEVFLGVGVRGVGGVPLLKARTPGNEGVAEGSPVSSGSVSLFGWPHGY